MALSLPATAWQASLWTASFRGVPFGVKDERGTAGRRGRVHEYPNRDQPYAEDLGRRARRFVIAAFLIGDDAAARRNALATACELRGPGELRHPTLGIVQVQIDPEAPMEWQERWDQGRYIEAQLHFVEAGQLQFPGGDSDTQAATQTAADKARDAVMADYQSAVTKAGGFGL